MVSKLVGRKIFNKRGGDAHTCCLSTILRIFGIKTQPHH